MMRWSFCYRLILSDNSEQKGVNSNCFTTNKLHVGYNRPKLLDLFCSLQNIRLTLKQLICTLILLLLLFSTEVVQKKNYIN